MKSQNEKKFLHKIKQFGIAFILKKYEFSQRIFSSDFFIFILIITVVHDVSSTCLIKYDQVWNKFLTSFYMILFFVWMSVQ